MEEKSRYRSFISIFQNAEKTSLFGSKLPPRSAAHKKWWVEVNWRRNTWKLRSTWNTVTYKELIKLLCRGNCNSHKNKEDVPNSSAYREWIWRGQMMNETFDVIRGGIRVDWPSTSSKDKSWMKLVWIHSEKWQKAAPTSRLPCNTNPTVVFPFREHDNILRQR